MPALRYHAGRPPGVRHARDLDEAADAYKDIFQVIDDLVEVMVELHPPSVVKG